MIALIASFVITGATVFTGEGPALENATVVVVGNRVTAVGHVRDDSGYRLLKVPILTQYTHSPEVDSRIAILDECPRNNELLVGWQVDEIVYSGTSRKLPGNLLGASQPIEFLHFLSSIRSDLQGQQVGSQEDQGIARSVAPAS